MKYETLALMADTQRKIHLTKQNGRCPFLPHDYGVGFESGEFSLRTTNSESSWHCFFDLLFTVVAIIIRHDGLPQTTLPLCPNGKRKCPCSAHRQITWPCLPLKRRDEYTAFKGWPFQEMFCKAEDPFYLTSSLSPVLYCTFSLWFLIASLHLALYKNWASRPWEDSYFGTLVCHLLDQHALWIKLYQFSRSVVSNALQPQESQYTRPPCPSPNPGIHSDSRSSSQWWHPAISSYVVPFSPCPQSLPPSESFPMSQPLRMRWPKYWSFSFSIIPYKEHPGQLSFRMDWLDLLAVQGTLNSLLQPCLNTFSLRFIGMLVTQLESLCTRTKDLPIMKQRSRVVKLTLDLD